ncbi:hypothetical protein ACET3Z_020775 [Daucus carota]
MRGASTSVPVGSHFSEYSVQRRYLIVSPSYFIQLSSEIFRVWRDSSFFIFEAMKLSGAIEQKFVKFFTNAETNSDELNFPKRL